MPDTKRNEALAVHMGWTPAVYPPFYDTGDPGWRDPEGNYYSEIPDFAAAVESLKGGDAS